MVKAKTLSIYILQHICQKQERTIMLKKILVVAISLAFLNVAAFADEPGTIALTGTGVVSAEPDQGYITVGVQTKSETSSAAVSENTKLMKVLFVSLKELGVEKKDVKTVNFAVQQSFRSVRTPLDNGRHTTTNVPDGFVVINQVRVTVCDLKNMGKVLDVLIVAGANRVQSISFGSSEAKKHLDAARKAAVQDVKSKATILAEGLDVKLGKVKTISEGNYSPRRETYSRMAVASAASNDVPISGGSLTFTINVSVVWELETENTILNITGPAKLPGKIGPIKIELKKNE